MRGLLRLNRFFATSNISTIVKLYFSYVIKITLKSHIWHENVKIIILYPVLLLKPLHKLLNYMLTTSGLLILIYGVIPLLIVNQISKFKDPVGEISVDPW